MADSFVTPWTIAHQIPLPTGFPRQDNWSEFPFPSPGDLPNPGIERESPAMSGRFSTTEPPGKPHKELVYNLLAVRRYLWSKELETSSYSQQIRLLMVLEARAKQPWEVLRLTQGRQAALF